MNSGLSLEARYSIHTVKETLGLGAPQKKIMWRGNIVNVESLNLFHYFLMMSHYPLSLYNLVYAKTTKYMLAKLIT